MSEWVSDWVTKWLSEWVQKALIESDEWRSTRKSLRNVSFAKFRIYKIRYGEISFTSWNFEISLLDEKILFLGIPKFKGGMEWGVGSEKAAEGVYKGREEFWREGRVP